MCLPLWGMWIEMKKILPVYTAEPCLPLWGKWIEILDIGAESEVSFVSSPVGEVD